MDLYRLFVLRNKLNKLYMGHATMTLLEDITEFRIEPIKEIINGNEHVTGVCILFETKEDPHNRKVALRDRIKEALESVIQEVGPALIQETIKKVKDNAEIQTKNLIEAIKKELEDMEDGLPSVDIKDIINEDKE